jgi:hypothetical protein
MPVVLNGAGVNVTPEAVVIAVGWPTAKVLAADSVNKSAKNALAVFMSSLL